MGLNSNIVIADNWEVVRLRPNSRYITILAKSETHFLFISDMCKGV